jgi:hypothetical protein
MNYFFRAKMSRFCVSNLENSGLFSTICTLNKNTLSPEKFNSDLIRGSKSGKMPLIQDIKMMKIDSLTMIRCAYAHGDKKSERNESQ